MAACSTARPVEASGRGPDPAGPIVIAVSSCLLGERVRYDGRHKLAPFLRDGLGPHVQLLSICPEVGIGLGVPRPPIRLVAGRSGPRLLGAEDDDHTAAMRAFAHDLCDRLHATPDLGGFVVKSASPSCGRAGVPVFGARGGPPSAEGPGIFTGVLLERLPLLPVEEEVRLEEPPDRERFLTRAFAFRRMRRRSAANGDLAAFHTREALLLRAHDPAGAAELDARMAAGATGDYDERFSRILTHVVSGAAHADLLATLAARLRPRLDDAARRVLGERIRAYERGEIPLAGALAAVRAQARAAGLADLADQTYLDPFPAALATRSS